MRDAFAGAVEKLARLETKWNGIFAAEIDYFLDSRSGGAFCDQHFFKRRARAGPRERDEYPWLGALQRCYPTRQLSPCFPDLFSFKVGKK